MLEDTDSIDVVADSADGQQLVLIITDGNVTPEPAARLALLNQKLRTYAIALTMSEFQAENSNYRNTLIKIVCAAAPTPEMSQIKSISVTQGKNDVQAVPVEFMVIPMTSL